MLVASNKALNVNINYDSSIPGVYMAGEKTLSQISRTNSFEASLLLQIITFDHTSKPQLQCTSVYTRACRVGGLSHNACRWTHFTVQRVLVGATVWSSSER